MTDKKRKKIIIVREHPRHVSFGNKNPNGITIVDQHLRRLHGTYLDSIEIESTLKNYDRSHLLRPTPRSLDFDNGNKYDEHIAIWTDYFNRKFNATPPIDPDVVKALIASESGFDPDPPGNKIVIGISQITKETLKSIQDPNGEVKDFIFQNVRQKDLKNPDLAIPISIRWLFRKKATAHSKLGRPPSAEELILEYKGLLKSTSTLKDKALENYRKNYAKLKKK